MRAPRSGIWPPSLFRGRWPTDGPEAYWFVRPARSDWANVFVCQARAPYSSRWTGKELIRAPYEAGTFVPVTVFRCGLRPHVLIYTFTSQKWCILCTTKLVRSAIPRTIAGYTHRLFPGRVVLFSQTAALTVVGLFVFKTLGCHIATTPRPHI